MSKQSSPHKINPQVKTVSVGTKRMREVQIYPLSMKDQLDLAKLVLELAQKASQGDFKPDKMSEEGALDFLQTFVSENVMKILQFACEENEIPSLDEITNDQFVEIATILYEVNYESFVKNFKDLFKRMKKLKEQAPEIPELQE